MMIFRIFQMLVKVYVVVDVLSAFYAGILEL